MTSRLKIFVFGYHGTNINSKCQLTAIVPWLAIVAQLETRKNDPRFLSATIAKSRYNSCKQKTLVDLAGFSQVHNYTVSQKNKALQYCP